MKTKAFIMATLVCSSFVFMSCDDDDDKFTPESIVTKAFDTKYPDAQRVSWENEAGYVKAEFYTGSYEAEAWFDPQGNWMLTETDLPYNALPQTVKNSFEASLYAKWKIDDVDMLHENIHKEVWLDTQNKWLYTEWEIRSSQVPDIVMTAFKASAYASYQIDDIHVIQKAEGLSYEFELEQGDRDITILFNEEGILVSPTH